MEGSSLRSSKKHYSYSAIKKHCARYGLSILKTIICNIVNKTRKKSLIVFFKLKKIFKLLYEILSTNQEKSH